MGRFGDGIYGSDKALDYLYIVTKRIERELAYWLSPEQVTASSDWLARILTVTEVVLLFEQYLPRGGIQLKVKTVERWRTEFFRVWDGDWKDKPLFNDFFEKAVYRQEKRPALTAMFDRLESIAGQWDTVENGRDRPALVDLHPDYPLPYFSLHDIRFAYRLLEGLAKDIIYYLSSEMRAEVEITDVEQVWVAVDLLAFLSEAYERSPSVDEQVVRNWRKTTFEIGEKFDGDDNPHLDESDRLYQAIAGAFDRLETVAGKYPPEVWWSE